VEPHIDQLPPELVDVGVKMVSIEEALAQADILVGLVAHRVFQKVSRAMLQEKIIVDACGMWR